MEPVKTQRDRPKERPSNTSVVLFVIVLAANVLALMPVLVTPTSTASDPVELTAVIAPAVLYAITLAVAVVSFRRKPPRAFGWIAWVIVPAAGLALCLLASVVTGFPVALAIFAAAALIGQIVVLSFFSSGDASSMDAG